VSPENKLARILALGGAFLASFILSPAWLEKNVPVLCLSRRLGFFCPACGLTRAFCAISHGDLLGAYTYNHLSPAVYVALALYLIYLLKDYFLKT
jgi:hypothetical protein